MNSRLRVLMTSPRFNTMGGIQVYAETLSSALPAVIVVHFVGARKGEQDTLHAVLRGMGDTCLFLWRALRLRSGPVHINTSLDRKSIVRDGVLVLIARMLRRPVLVFFHGWAPDMEAALRRSSAPLFRRVFGRVDLVCVLADRFAAALRDVGVVAPIVRETTFVDERLLADAGEPGRRSAGVQILYLSRALRAKGLFVALEVYRRLKVLHPDLSLVIGGDGPDRAEAEALAKEQGMTDVHFPGHVTGRQKHELLTGSDLFLFPSTYGEGLPISLVEAMAAGLPVVTTRQGGIPDFFVDGWMGVSVDAPDPDILADLIHTLLCSPERRQAISAYNRDYARAHFAASAAGERILAHYNRLASSS